MTQNRFCTRRNRDSGQRDSCVQRSEGTSESVGVFSVRSLHSPDASNIPFVFRARDQISQIGLPATQFPLHQNIFDYFPMHIGQPKIPPLEFVRQSFVIDPQLMQQRCLEIVHVHRVLDHVHCQVIGLAV